LLQVAEYKAEWAKLDKEIANCIPRSLNSGLLWLIVAYCGLFLQCENSEKHVSTSILGRRHKMSMMRNGRRKPSSGRQR